MELLLDPSSDFKRTVSCIFNSKIEDNIIAIVLLDRKGYHIDKIFECHGHMIILVFEGITKGTSDAESDLILNQVVLFY